MKTSAGTFFKPGGRGLIALAAAAILYACASGGGISKGSLGYAVASWYGPDFHGKLTASGERYDMDAMTCAHKELPFGTRLKVKNVKNGKTVLVVVNDRGPFVRGRELDLSRAAAEKLELIGPGTGKVYISALGRDERYRKYLKDGALPASRPKEGPYTVQVAAFSDPSNAQYMKQGLELKYKKVFIMEKWIGGERFYRVRIGKFRSEEKARKYAETLADEGYQPEVMQF